MTRFRCKQCKLLVDEIPLWKMGECPKDPHQHRFEKVKG